MRTVNYWLIWDALGALERAEAAHGGPLGIDPNDEVSVRTAFDKYITSEIANWSTLRTEQLKLSLAYFLDYLNILDDSILANLPNLTMSQPRDVFKFFMWLWESLYPMENRLDILLERNIHEDNDVLQVNKSEVLATPIKSVL